MLQQTQVARVEPAWRRFFDRFPTVTDAATSGRSDLVRLWAGLGYNNRAVRLHQAARAVVERFDGTFPHDLADLMSLPGIGPYTARAIRAFAFELPGAVVDTNVLRILVRLGGERLTPAMAQRAADALADEIDPWTWNQSMIDLGATICSPRNPACDRCPLYAGCSWRGGPGADPAAVTPSKRQVPFAGSDRQARGRLLDACRSGPVAEDDVPGIIADDDADRVERIVSGLVRDGLLRRHGRRVSLVE
jgi:A/G-specific adenine glycosylase